MRTFRHPNKRLTGRGGNGRFRQITAEDVGIGACPVCSGITSRPPEPAEFAKGNIDPRAFNEWQKARHCPQCGWKKPDYNAEIEVNLNGRRGTVKRSEYIAAKTKDLREFGYMTLTEEAVSTQLERILAGKETDVIGAFMKDDIVVPVAT